MTMTDNREAVSAAHRSPAAKLVHYALVDVWNSGDVDTLDSVLAPDYVRHGRSDDTDAKHIKQTIREAREAFPDMRTVAEHQLVDGDMVATHWRCSGTHEGPFYDLPVTHKKIDIEGMTFSRVHDGQIVEEWESWSKSDLFSSLGVANLWEA
jgi:steroid delta-isomerase-like uncharacterized protein